MQFFSNTKIDFQGVRKYAYMFSGSLILISIISLILHGGPRYSIDFTGGLSIRVQFAKPVTEHEVRKALESANMGDAEVKTIQETGGEPEIMIRVKQSLTRAETQHVVAKTLQDYFKGNTLDIRSVEIVGPKIGKDLRNAALISTFVTLLLIMFYLWWRFEMIFGVGAIIALFHDIIITVGVFSVFNLEISMNVVAALLTILGYSINDTIVVFDRIRENLRKQAGLPLKDIINNSINETLSRTIITSMLTWTVVVALLILGGRVIHDFALALTIGIFYGTYSSIYIASPILLEWGKKELLRKKKPVRK
jgi:preprotein translocase subunit SecF